MVGGLADYALGPFQTAIPTSNVLSFLAPVADARLTTIVGFTELSSDGWIYNSAAVVSQGRLAGVYRKRHPAIRRSVYRAGKDSPVFQVDGAGFGILICYDSTFPELAASLASRGARVIFVPTNNALPASKPSTEHRRRGPGVRRRARDGEPLLGCAGGRGGHGGGLRSEGSSAIISPAGKTVSSARALSEDLLVAEIGLAAV